MHRTKIAEFFLSRLTTRDQAAAIVGDLLETCPGPLTFWFAVARIAAAFLRRPAFAIVVTIAASHLIRPGLAQWNAMTKMTGMAAFCVFCAFLLSMIAVYSAVRRGPLDPITKTAGALGLVASAALPLWKSASGAAICGMIAVALVAALLRIPTYRRSLLWVLAAGVCAIAGSYVAWYSLYPILTERLAPHHPWRFRWFSLMMDVSITLAIAACLSWSKRQEATERPTYT